MQRQAALCVRVCRMASNLVFEQILALRQSQKTRKKRFLKSSQRVFLLAPLFPSARLVESGALEANLCVLF